MSKQAKGLAACESQTTSPFALSCGGCYDNRDGQYQHL